jgi:uncharacterized damage-inducible protein DinB
MLKRTYGRLLLTLLVISGLAGTLRNTSLSKKERKYATTLMKDTKSDLAQSLKGLSDAQLNFKPNAESWSVKECMYHIAISEKNLWGMMEGAMKAAATPDKRSEVKMTDEQVVAALESREQKVKTFAPFEPQNTPFKTLDEAMTSFKELRAEHIKYMKTTTEDLRNHMVQMPFGTLDCYQLCLMMAAHTERHRKQMEEVKANPNFPK